jgi:hypothetical protein
MKISARNRFNGKVAEITNGATAPHVLPTSEWHDRGIFHHQ